MSRVIASPGGLDSNLEVLVVVVIAAVCFSLGSAQVLATNAGSVNMHWLEDFVESSLWYLV